MDRPQKFLATTPFVGAPEVCLYADTWHDHILKGHPEMAPHLQAVQETLQAPTAIYSSATTSGSYCYVNTSVSDSRGAKLRVAVKPKADDIGVVTSAYFSTNVTPGMKVWP